MSTILVIDDNLVDLELLRQGLEKAGYEVVAAESGDEGLRCMEVVRPDLVLLDVHMPQMDGFTVLQRLRAGDGGNDLPIVMVSADHSDHRMARCLEAGANEYVAKPVSFTELNARIRNLLQRRSQFAGVERRAAELKKRVTRDSLTGVMRRQAFIEAACEAFDRARRSGARLTAVYLDLDHFKEVNDRHGHHAGDRALQAVGRSLREVLREHDLCGRMGGDEFAACLPETHPLEALDLVEQIRQRLFASIRDDKGNRVPLSISAGIAEFHEEPDLETLLIQADMALYQAKHRGRNRVVIRDVPVES